MKAIRYKDGRVITPHKEQWWKRLKCGFEGHNHMPTVAPPKCPECGFALGSSQSPCPLTEGQVVLSGQLMRLFVNVPNLSGNIQIGGSRILGGLIGFYWPR